MALSQALDRSGQCYTVSLHVSQPMKEELQWWSDHLAAWNGKTLIAHKPSLVIESDASRTGWGAVCQGSRTGGPWSETEQQWHINCLEALAAFLAVKCFARDRRGVTILLRMDNITAVTYVNKLGGTVSQQMNSIVKELWLWCMNRDITLTAEHLPGFLNTIADEESRVMKDNSDWMLHPRVFNRIQRRWGPLEVDMFASHSTFQVFQLETGPRGGGSECLCPGLGASQRGGVCQPSMGSDQQGADLSQSAENFNSPSGTSTEVTAMVPQTAGDVDRLPVQDSNGRGHIPTSVSGKPTSSGPSISCLEYLRHRFRDKSISEEGTELLLASWRQKSAQSYDSLFRKWVCWCVQRNSDPVSGPINEVINFLAYLFKEGYQYHSLNAYRSAISSVHDRVDGYEIGQHPLVSRLLKGVFNSRPPQPRYEATWDVKIVLIWMENLRENADLSLQDLTIKLIMLLSLTRPARSSDLANLDIRYRKYLPEGVTFQPVSLAKQTRQNKPRADFFFPKFPHNPRLCPVQTLQAYERRTKELRGESTDGQQRLFLATVKPHKAVAPTTIARWLRMVLDKAGIDSSIFEAHSMRGASTSAAARAGITTADIMKAAEWNSESVFQRFYYKPTRDSSFGTAVLAIADK